MKIISERSLPPDDPIYSSGPQVFSPLGFKGSSKTFPTNITEPKMDTGNKQLDEIYAKVFAELGWKEAPPDHWIYSEGATASYVPSKPQDPTPDQELPKDE